MDEAHEEVIQYLEGLIRKHLREVRYEGPTLVLDPQTREFSTGMCLKLWAAELQSDNDVVLSRMLQAANRVREDAVGEEANVLNGFLDQFTGILRGVGASEAAGFLQNVLEDLIRRDQLDEYELEDEEEDDFTGRGMTVTIGNRSMSVAFEDILSCFWSEDSQLNTTCHTRGKPFINEPPIRTIAKGDKQQGASDVHVRVYNRHFSCVPSDRGFVPVSHVWDNSIRAANSDPNRGHNNAAASKLIATLEALFDDTNENVYNVGVEFWHDYFSVPQWHSELKDALLLRLPAIYYTADEILVHMADIPSSYPWLLILGRGLIEGNDPLLQAMGKIPLLRAVCSSQWMQRMWVTLEYSQCRAACIMDKKKTIFTVSPTPPPCLPDAWDVTPSQASSTVLTRNLSAFFLTPKLSPTASAVQESFSVGWRQGDVRERPKNDICASARLLSSSRARSVSVHATVYLEYTCS